MKPRISYCPVTASLLFAPFFWIICPSSYSDATPVAMTTSHSTSANCYFKSSRDARCRHHHCYYHISTTGAVSMATALTYILPNIQRKRTFEIRKLNTNQIEIRWLNLFILYLWFNRNCIKNNIWKTKANKWMSPEIFQKGKQIKTTLTLITKNKEHLKILIRGESTSHLQWTLKDSLW